MQAMNMNQKSYDRSQEFKTSVIFIFKTICFVLF